MRPKVAGVDPKSIRNRPVLAPSASYKSEGQPSATGTQSFEEALASSGLTEDHPAYLRAL